MLFYCYYGSVLDAPVQLVCEYCGLTHSVVGIVYDELYAAYPVPVCAFVLPYVAPAPQSNVILYRIGLQSLVGYMVPPFDVAFTECVVVFVWSLWAPSIEYPFLHVQTQ